MSTPPRRTQAQRKEGTIAAVVEATVEALSQVGYTKTTTNEIARRAGISQGGLFRHFGSRLDVIAAAADAIRARQLIDFRAGLEGVDDVDVVQIVQLLRRVTRSPFNVAWHELLIAVRTDAELHARLAPVAQRFDRDILAFARELPFTRHIPADDVDTIVMGIVHMLDGEAIAATLHPQPDQEGRRDEQLARLLDGEPLFDRESGTAPHG